MLDQILVQQEQQIKQYLKTVPYQILVQQRKKQRQDQRAAKPKPEKLPKQKTLTKQKTSKDEPVERPAKTPVSVFKTVFEPKRKPSIDPRFEGYAGKLDPDLAKKSFSFIGDLQLREKDELKKKLSSKKINPYDKQILRHRYNQVTDSLKANEYKQIEKQVVKQYKHGVREKVNSGQNAYFKSKKIIKQEIEFKKLERLTEAQKNKLYKEKKSDFVSKMQYKKRQYLRETA